MNFRAAGEGAHPRRDHEPLREAAQAGRRGPPVHARALREGQQLPVAAQGPHAQDDVHHQRALHAAGSPLRQANSIKLLQSRDQLDAVNEESRKRVEEDLPPQPETEIEYLKYIRDQKRYAEENAIRKQREIIERNIPPFATKTNAEHRYALTAESTSTCPTTTSACPSPTAASSPSTPPRSAPTSGTSASPSPARSKSDYIN